MIVGKAFEARNRLKRETLDLHRRAEASFDRADWLASSASYATLLERWTGLLGVLATSLAPFFGEEELAGQLGRRRRRLEADLTALGPAVSGPSSLTADPPPIFADEAEAFGALYVLEGSALGGRIIARRVQDRLGPAMPTAFLDDDGAAIGASWLAFLGRLDRALDTPDAIDGAVRGARRAFLLVETWLGDQP